MADDKKAYEAFRLRSFAQSHPGLPVQHREQIEEDDLDEGWDMEGDGADGAVPTSKRDTSLQYHQRRVILHFDCDCFYAQVEEVRNPALRDVPLGVTQKYLIVTCNYLARAAGVTKLMNTRDALARCPHLVLVPGEDLGPYRQASKAIFAVLSRYGTAEKLGLDETYVDVTQEVLRRLHSGTFAPPAPPPRLVGHLHTPAACAVAADTAHRPQDLRAVVPAAGGGPAGAAAAAGTIAAAAPAPVSGEAEAAAVGGGAAAAGPLPIGAATAAPGAVGGGTAALVGTAAGDDWRLLLAVGSMVAAEARAAVRAETGIRSSAGIAPNKLLAKLVSGLHKPDDQTVISPQWAAEFVGPLPLRALPGVGFKTERLLSERLGAATAADVRRYSRQQLAEVLGDKAGCLLHQWVRGCDPAPVRPTGPPRSITVEDSFRCCSSRAAAEAVVRVLAPDLLGRLAEEWAENRRRPATLTLKWRLAGTGWTRTSASADMPPNLLSCLPYLAGGKHAEPAQVELLVRVATQLLFRHLREPFHLTLINIGATNFKQEGGAGGGGGSTSHHHNSMAGGSGGGSGGGGNATAGTILDLFNRRRNANANVNPSTTRTGADDAAAAGAAAPGMYGGLGGGTDDEDEELYDMASPDTDGAGAATAATLTEGGSIAAAAAGSGGGGGGGGMSPAEAGRAAERSAAWRRDYRGAGGGAAGGAVGAGQAAALGVPLLSKSRERALREAAAAGAAWSAAGGIAVEGGRGAAVTAVRPQLAPQSQLPASPHGLMLPPPTGGRGASGGVKGADGGSGGGAGSARQQPVSTSSSSLQRWTRLQPPRTTAAAAPAPAAATAATDFSVTTTHAPSPPPPLLSSSFSPFAATRRESVAARTTADLADVAATPATAAAAAADANTGDAVGAGPSGREMDALDPAVLTYRIVDLYGSRRSGIRRTGRKRRRKMSSGSSRRHPGEGSGEGDGGGDGEEGRRWKRKRRRRGSGQQQQQQQPQQDWQEQQQQEGERLLSRRGYGIAEVQEGSSDDGDGEDGADSSDLDDAVQCSSGGSSGSDGAMSNGSDDDEDSSSGNSDNSIASSGSSGSDSDGGGLFCWASGWECERWGRQQQPSSPPPPLPPPQRQRQQQHPAASPHALACPPPAPDSAAPPPATAAATPPSPSSAAAAPRRVILHVDVDCFYCQVERLDDPSLLGAPLAVTQFNAGGFVAVSYEARAAGVRCGDGVGAGGRAAIPHLKAMGSLSLAAARRRCPSLVVRPMRVERYRQVAEQVQAVIRRFSPCGQVEKASYDDFYLDVTA
ncbi:hypothetical protein Agub_g2851, partial [Astrephomene gubernaculifera]